MPNAMKYAQLASARARNWCKDIPAANPVIFRNKNRFLFECSLFLIAFSIPLIQKVPNLKQQRFVA